MDAFKALALLKPAGTPAPAPLPRIHAPVLDEPRAKDMESMHGLVKTNTAVPLAERTTQAKLPFENVPVRSLFLANLRKGYPLKTVAQAAGFRMERLRTWIARGKNGLEPYASFVHELETAQAAGQLEILDDVRSASRGAPDKDGIWKNKWEAGKWLLAVGDPGTFQETTKSISAHVELPAPTTAVNVREMSDEDLEALVDVLDRAPTIDVKAIED
jgi:hypothetical protein